MSAIYEIHTREIYAHEMHDYNVYPHEMHAYERHASDR
jgi:hypothetical protein